MEATYMDRILSCSDCLKEFIFTAGEQLFFSDKQFKNDPKRCKPCKSRRSGLADAANGIGAAAGHSRTETRTECSECAVQTTVPFKPTQGRPVLCRQCFQMKMRAAKLPAASPEAQAISALKEASVKADGATLSPNAALLAVASMAAASAGSSVASAADLASLSAPEPPSPPFPPGSGPRRIPSELIAAASQESTSAELRNASPENAADA